jgi:energy-converting hydrogenase B subunit N
MRAFLLREMFMDLLYYISGNRVQPSAPILGGVRPRCDIPPSLGRVILETVDRGEDAYTKFVERLLADPLVMSRVTGVGILDYNTAMRLHAVGPTARASGVKLDWRKDPVQNPAYQAFDFNVVVLDWCDTKARVATRALEVFEQFKILRQAVKNLPDGPVIDRSWKLGQMGFTDGYFEAPRGELYHSTSLDDFGRIRHYKIRTPSLTNNASMEEACIGDHLTDAVLTIASCDPCLSCTNRFTIVDSKRDKTRVMTGVEIIGKYGRRRRR